MLVPVSRFGSDRRGSGAVEFALIAPIFLVVLFGIVVFGTVISTFNGVQQLTAEAARASMGGNTDTERDQLARDFVTRTLPNYPYLDATKLTIATLSMQTPRSFKVSLSYDMSNLFAFHLGTIIPLPAPTLTRSTVVLLSS